MKLKQNNERYAPQHDAVMRTMLEYIYSDLKQTGHIPDDEIEALTGTIAFHIGAVLDGAAGVETEGKEVFPYLAFSDSMELRENLTISESGSHLHEIVDEILDGAAFEREH